MNFFYDFFPIFLFFIAYKTFDIFVATIVAMIATLAQVMITRLKTGKFNKSSLISFFAIAILGGATIVFKNELFIKWKTTAVYWILAIIFLITAIASKKTVLEHLIKDTIDAPAKAWKKLNNIWVLFFAFMGSLNLYIAYNFSTDFWVNFKLFGTLGLTIVFVILQSLYLMRFDSCKKK